MTICDETQSIQRSVLLPIVKLFLFLVMQGTAVILVGFVALFVSFEPVWSAETPSEARAGSLLFKTDDGYCRRNAIGRRR